MKSEYTRILSLIPVAAALALADTSRGAVIQVSSYTYDTTQPYVWGDPGNVKLTDGRIATSTGYGAAEHVGLYNAQTNPQITLNLGAVYDLATVTLSYHADPDVTTGDPPVHFTGFGPENILGDRLWISVSNNNITYSPAVEYSPFSGPTGEVTSSMDVTGMNGQYLRLRIQSHPDAWGASWVFLSEVAVASIPEPTAPLLGGLGLLTLLRRRRA